MGDRLGKYPPTRAIERARGLRRDSTPPEKLVWSALRNRRLGGLKFRRQAPVGPFVVDFVCEEKSLVVEIDGDTHEGREARDAARTAFLTRQGLRVVRLQNRDVLENLEGAVWFIAREAGIELADKKRSPLPPLPPPEMGVGSNLEPSPSGRGQGEGSVEKRAGPLEERSQREEPSPLPPLPGGEGTRR